MNFSTDPDPRVAALGTKVIRIPKEKLLMGLANSWAADAEKFLLIMPEDCGKAYSTLADSTKPRGWMFWNIQDEGKEAKTVQVIDGHLGFLHVASLLAENTETKARTIVRRACIPQLRFSFQECPFDDPKF